MGARGDHSIAGRRLDLALAAALFAISLVIALGAPGGRRSLDALGAALLLLQTGPLLARRRWPLPVLLVVGAAIVAYSLLGYPLTVAGSAVLFAFYTVVVESDRRTALAVAVVAAIAIAISLAGSGAPVETYISTYGVYAAVFLAADNVRLRRAYTREAAARLEAVSREREERERRIVADERVRIARELHDVVAHHVSVIVIQAGAGTRAVEGGMSGAGDALAAIGSTGRLALEELRRMLGLLRTGATPADDGNSPQPGVAQLDELIRRVAEAGLRVDLRIEGEPVSLPAGIDLAAYRVVQEALTNILRYAGTDSATVTLRYGDALVIEVANAGGNRGERDAVRGAGQGLVGMRERVALYGGSIEAGPTAAGFRVAARIPLVAAGLPASVEPSVEAVPDEPVRSSTNAPGRRPS